MQEGKISMQEGREVEGKSVIRIIPMNIYYSHRIPTIICNTFITAGADLITGDLSDVR